MTYRTNILSAQQLRKLSEHKYSCHSDSLMDPLLQPWWNWLVSKTPLWLAPNLITIIGLFVNIVTTLILIMYSPDGQVAPPRWTCLLCAVGLFVYQSLDSIDGKQARRTNTSSPLGELFDHGCDSVSTVFVALSACISCQLGHYPNWLFFQCFCAIALFYCAHWQTYVSGTLRFGKIDVTEAQFTIMGIHMISFIFGPEIWLQKMPLVDGHWNLVILIGITICYVVNFFNFSKMFIQGGSGKNGSTVAGTSVLSPSIPLMLVILPAFIIAQKSPENVFATYPSLYIIAFGLVGAKVTNKLVIAHMTKAEMEYLDWSLLGPLCLFLNQYFNCVITEKYLLYFTLAWSIQDFARYCWQVCNEICRHLEIKLFTIPYKGGRGVNQGSSAVAATVSQGTTTTATTNSHSLGGGGGANGGTAHHRKSARQLSKKQQHNNQQQQH